ncbi:helix-turn-helix domain-containing protein [Streptomyces sp. NPDC059785]|uniref:helix-turn-helix domain-containing protein n=1 Tax=Streptomyces sp. NPDC059785 TaxID=3346945 RepID=UPI003656E284
MTTAEHSPACPLPTGRSGSAGRPGLMPLRQARERFLTGRPLPDGVPDDIVAAWRRARFYGVRHDDVRNDGVWRDGVRRDGVRHDDLRHDGARAAGGPPRPAGAALLAAARPVLERIAPALGTGPSHLVLTDERLRVLWTAGTAPGHGRCADLSEQEVGHNSAALALRTRRRSEVHGPEHFLDLWQDVSAVSVPVLTPGTGRVLGTVTVATALCPGRGPHPGAALAEAAAAAVEAELPAPSRTADRVLLDAYARVAEERRRAVVAVDGRNRLVNESAARLLSPEALDALERRARAVLTAAATAAPDAANALDTGVSGPGTGPDSVAAAVAELDLGLPADAGCTAHGSLVRHQGHVIGVVAVLEPVDPGPVPAPAPRRPRISLVGGSVPWLHAVDRATELARSPEPLLLTGERGTGKTALARELLAGRAVTVLDAAEEPAGAIGHALGTWAATGAAPVPVPPSTSWSSASGGDGAPPGAGHTLLLRHAELLAQPDIAALNSLLDGHPGAPLLITYAPGATPGPCFQRLRDTLAARTVTVPALRERPEDIRELLAVLTPRPGAGQPPLTWALDTLRALERHPWPGNVTELAHLVRALAEQRRATGPVRRADLPDAVREGPATRPLSPMEQAERTAILEALRRHGGNKARAAASLGIARATLYRKLRGYRG